MVDRIACKSAGLQRRTLRQRSRPAHSRRVVGTVCRSSSLPSPSVPGSSTSSSTSSGGSGGEGCDLRGSAPGAEKKRRGAGKKPPSSGEKPPSSDVTIWARTDLTVRDEASNWFKLACVTDSRTPVLLKNQLDIHEADHTALRLSDGARRCIDTPNAGGTSEWSEAVSFELLHHVYGAKLLRTEMEIEYRGGSKITDYAIMLNGQHLGVSVTRAMAYNTVFTAAEAHRLLDKKLAGVIASTRGVIKQHRWSRQILHVIAQDPAYVPLLEQAYHALDDTLKHDTIVLITVAATNSAFMF